MSFDSRTFRKNNNGITVGERPVILAIGDSYTVGVEVITPIRGRLNWN
jgi:hypothetical protein